jgi:hypothetical protein
MRIIAFVTAAPVVNTILPIWASPPAHPKPAPDSIRGGPRARPPLWDQAAEPVPDWADSPAPLPAFVFDQPLDW